MRTIHLGGFGFVTNTNLISSYAPDGNPVINIDMVRALPPIVKGQKANNSWVFAIPTDRDPLPVDVQSLIDDLQNKESELVQLYLNGVTIAGINFLVYIANADGTNDFGFTGKVLIINRA